MISFKRFLLNENSIEYIKVAKDNLSDLRSLILRDCQPFLNESQYMPLYRGMRLTPATPFAAKVIHPKDREPIDSGLIYNDVLNTSFKNRFGVENVRKRSIYTSGSFTTASMYGREYFFFPIGQIDYTFFPGISDSYENFKSLLVKVCKQLQDAIPKFKQQAPHPVNDEDFKSGGRFGWLFYADDLADVIKLMDRSGFETLPKEITLEKARYLTARMAKISTELNDSEFPSPQVNHISEILVAWWPMINEALVNGIGNQYVVNSNLADAIINEDEIAFFKTDGYYIVHAGSLSTHVDENLPYHDMYRQFLKDG